MKKSNQYSIAVIIASLMKSTIFASSGGPAGPGGRMGSSSSSSAAAAARVAVDDEDYLRHEDDPADMSAEERDMLREIRQVFPKFSAFNYALWQSDDLPQRAITTYQASVWDDATRAYRLPNQAERMDYQKQTLQLVRTLTNRYSGIAFRLTDGVPNGYNPDQKAQQYILDTVPVTFDIPAPEELAWFSADEWREFATAVLDARPRRYKLADGKTVGQWLRALEAVHTYFHQGFAEVEYLIDEADVARGSPMSLDQDLGADTREGNTYARFSGRDSAELSVRALNDMSSDARNPLGNNRTREAIVMLRAPLADLRDGYRVLVRELDKDPEERSTERMQRALGLLGKALPFLGAFVRSTPTPETRAPNIADIRAWLGRLDAHAKLRALQSVRHHVGSVDESRSDAASSLTCPDTLMHERRLMGWNLADLRIGDTARSLRQGERVWRAVLVDNATPIDMAHTPWVYSLHGQGLQHIPALRRFQAGGMIEPFTPGSIIVSKRAEESRGRCLYRIFEITREHAAGYGVLAKPVALVDLLPGSAADLARSPLEGGDRISSGVRARLHARLRDVARDTGRASATFRDLDAAERTRWLEEDDAYREAQIQRNLGEQGLSSSYIPAAERTRGEGMHDDAFEAAKARNAGRVSEELKTRMAFARKNSDDEFIASLSPSRLHMRVHAADRMSARERSFYGDNREGGYLDVLESKLAGDADLSEALSVRAHVHDNSRARYQVSMGAGLADASSSSRRENGGAAGGYSSSSSESYDEYESIADALADYDAPRRSATSSVFDPRRAGGHGEEETLSRIRIIERLLDRADNPRLQEELAALKAKLGRRD